MPRKKNGGKRCLKPHYPPTYDPIKRLMDAMRRDSPHNRHFGNFRKFNEAIFGFFDKTVPNGSESPIYTVPDSFTVIGRDDGLDVG